MTKANRPLESFDPELLQLLSKGAREVIIFSALNKGPKGSPAFELELKRFAALRQRLHQLRYRLSELSDPRAPALYKCFVSIPGKHSPDFGKMIIQPRDNAFGDLMSQAGISSPDLPPDFSLEGGENDPK